MQHDTVSITFSRPKHKSNYRIVVSVNSVGPQAQNRTSLFFCIGGTNPSTKSMHTLPFKSVHSA